MSLIPGLHVQPELSEEDPNHVEEMVAKADRLEGASQEPSKEEPQEPSKEEPQETLLAGKYKTEEDLTAGILELLKKQNDGKSLEEIYKSLESDLGRPKEEPKSESPALEKDEGDENKSDGPIDFSSFEQEFIRDGSLSDESIKALESKGIPREIIETYQEGLKAMAQLQMQAVYSIVGGEDNYRAMIQWAAQELPEAEQRAFNDAVAGTPEQARFAVEALYSRYLKTNGQPPDKLILGENSGQRTTSGYTSRQQMIEDMSDPRYRKDPAFRAEVERKIKLSNIL